jgi:hypothetical protein
MKKRPSSTEYNDYYSSYVESVPDGDIVHILNEQINETHNLLQDISNTQGQFRYAPGKWSLKEVVGHITDTERIMGYRLLSIARGDSTPLPGYDENVYVENAVFDNQSMDKLLKNLNAVRQSTIHLLQSLETDTWARQGTANYSQVTVRALAYIIAGHELHHRKFIKERYLNLQ